MQRLFQGRVHCKEVAAEEKPQNHRLSVKLPVVDQTVHTMYRLEVEALMVVVDVTIVLVYVHEYILVSDGLRDC